MIPKFSHLFNIDHKIASKSGAHDGTLNGGCSRAAGFVTTDGIRGLIVRLEVLDSESSNYFVKTHAIERWLENTSPKLLVRFLREVTQSPKIEYSSRAEEIFKLGAKKNSLLLSIEYRGSIKALSEIKTILGLSKAKEEEEVVSLLASTIEELKSAGIGFSYLTEDEIKAEFFWSEHKVFRACGSYLELGDSVLGAVRLTRQTSNPLNVSSLGELLGEISAPFKIITSVRRVDEIRREFLLRTKVKQEESSADRISQIKANAVGEALESTYLKAKELFEFEFIVLVRDLTESILRVKLKAIAEGLANLGDLSIETFGLFPTLAASQIGANQHVTLFELGEALMAFLPISGCCDPFVREKTEPRSLITHRKDLSLTEVDLFAKNHLNSNSLIIGSSGRGKSVFTGMLTSSLLNDPSVTVIKVDVGGSHSRECELYGGIEFQLNLNEPSGINPFGHLNLNGSGLENSEAIRSILSKFIEVLILEENEVVLPKTTRIELENLLLDYIESKPKNASLNDFGMFAKNFSRKTLLSRWWGSGLYGRAFKAAGHPCPSIEPASAFTAAPHPCGSPRLRYYNFSQIFEAADRDFAQAGMAAVLAQFNLELLNQSDKRVVLICDETPFFIDKCFEFFKFSMANVRKFGASITLITQLSQHLIKNGDTGLFENAYHKFLFSSDGSPDDFAQRLGVAPALVEEIKNLESIPGQKSEVLYLCGTEAKRIVLRLTPEEYWRVTSTQGERVKIEKLRSAVPELSLKEALTCLSLIS